MPLQNGRQILLYELCVWNTEKAMQEQGKPVNFTVYHLQSLRLVVEMILPIWFDNVDESFASKKVFFRCFTFLWKTVVLLSKSQMKPPKKLVIYHEMEECCLLLHVGGKCGSANTYPKWKSLTSRKRWAIDKWRRGGKIGESTSCGKNSDLLNIYSIHFIAASLATSISASLVIIYLSSTEYRPLPSGHRL